MSHYFGDVKAAIVDIIRTQSTKAKVVYDYEETQPTGYPAVMVVSQNSPGTWIDTQRTRREFTFVLRCMQERLEATPQVAEQNLTALVDELIALFDGPNTNYNLENTVVFNEPPDVKWGYMSVPDAEMRTCELTLTGIAVQ